MNYFAREIIKNKMVDNFNGFEVEMICKLLNCNVEDIIEIEEEYQNEWRCFHLPELTPYDGGTVQQSDIYVNKIELIEVDLRIGNHFLNYGSCGKCSCGKVYWKRGKI